MQVKFSTLPGTKINAQLIAVINITPELPSQDLKFPVLFRGLVIAKILPSPCQVWLFFFALGV